MPQKRASSCVVVKREIRGFMTEWLLIDNLWQVFLIQPQPYSTLNKEGLPGLEGFKGNPLLGAAHGFDLEDRSGFIHGACKGDRKAKIDRLDPHASAS